MRNRWFLQILGNFLLFCIAFVAFGILTTFLWNWLMPDLFHLPDIDFAQGMGLVLLCKILFGSIRVKAPIPMPVGQRKLWKAKWESMSEEDQENFRQEFAEKCRNKWGRTQPKVKAEKE